MKSKRQIQQKLEAVQAAVNIINSKIAEVEFLKEDKKIMLAEIDLLENVLE